MLVVLLESHQLLLKIHITQTIAWLNTWTKCPSKPVLTLPGQKFNQNLQIVLLINDTVNVAGSQGRGYLFLEITEWLQQEPRFSLMVKLLQRDKPTLTSY